MAPIPLPYLPFERLAHANVASHFRSVTATRSGITGIRTTNGKTYARKCFGSSFSGHHSANYPRDYEVST